MVSKQLVRNFTDIRSLLVENQLLPSEILTNRGYMTHIYIKLDIESRYENSTTTSDAITFLEAVARSAIVAERLSQKYNGAVLEAQGSTLHVAIPSSEENNFERINDYVYAVHKTYEILFKGSAVVHGWRMACDTGFTLIVNSQDVHNDTSLVSLGNSANRPAKHLYKQLDYPEKERSLKRFFVSFRKLDQITNTYFWKSSPIEKLSRSLVENHISLAEDVSKQDVQISLSRTEWQHVSASAAPIQPAGTPGSPTPSDPDMYFGWVMRADLDGFTQRVHDCDEDNKKLDELSSQFSQIMALARDFTNNHQETMAQLPWAGDNYTAAIVFANRDDYLNAMKNKPIDIILDFSQTLKLAAENSGFGGWAYGIAGGNVHGNANANLFIGSIEFNGRRLLIGAGMGVGRSFQAFGSVNPKKSEIACYIDDVQSLRKEYRCKFHEAINNKNDVSALYKIASINELDQTRDEINTAPTSITITPSKGKTEKIPVKPYYS